MARGRKPCVAALVLAFLTGGCAIGRLPSVSPEPQAGPAPAPAPVAAQPAPAEPPLTTGSIGPRAASAPAPSLQPGDLVIVGRALVSVLDEPRPGAMLPWENPETGLSGNVTPIAAAHSQNGATCRHFLVSAVSREAETWLTGEACKAPGGAWGIRELKPLARGR